MTYKIVDKQLRDLVVRLLRDNHDIKIDKLSQLLDKGANPKAVILQDEFSAYQLVEQYNNHGKYNAILEVFDEHLDGLNRPADSDWEGMHG